MLFTRACQHTQLKIQPAGKSTPHKYWFKTAHRWRKAKKPTNCRKRNYFLTMVQIYISKVYFYEAYLAYASSTLCKFTFCLFFFLSFRLDITVIKCLKSQVSKVICVQILKWRSVSDTGCFFNWYPPKKLKCGKPSLGESTLT